MTKGFDCSTPLTTQTAAAFVKDGYSFVARYLVPSGAKALTKTEADLISASGLQILSVYETTANRALEGRSAGLADGVTALKVASDVGQPAGSCIYFAVDFDATTEQLPTVIAYIQGASEATPGYLTGVYGSYGVLEAVQAAGVCSRYWQTYAWSQGNKSTFMHVYQYENDVTINGINVDFDESYGSEGLWITSTTPVSYLMTPADADKVIPFLGASYQATSSSAAQTEFHRLANELRKASGQPEE